MKPLPDPCPIEPLTKPPNCTITVPGSKSITNRALILAALAKGKSTLRGALWADDTQVMVDSLNKLGIKTTSSKPDENFNCDIEVEGQDGKIPKSEADLYVGNAGTAARFLTALVCLGHGEYRISGDARMHERPMKELFDALGTLGATIRSTNGNLPAKIHAEGLHEGTIYVSAERSSQFASALHLIAPRIRGLTMHGHLNSEANSYVQMTLDMQSRFPSEFGVEPDLSSASYFSAIEYISGGQIIVAGRPTHSLQIDGEFSKFLPPPAKSVSRASDLGDSVMTLAICALFGENVLIVKDAAKLRLQETDRIKAMVTELQRVGAKAEEHEDGFTVWPAKQGQLHGADIETYNDHRMAMCFSVLGLKVPGIRIKNPQCVSKTFPNFFEKLEQLRQ